MTFPDGPRIGRTSLAFTLDGENPLTATGVRRRLAAGG
jgi:hypothetical protein